MVAKTRQIIYEGTNATVRLSQRGYSMSGAIEIAKSGATIAASFFQIAKNPDLKIRIEIEKEMRRWYVWTTFPKDAGITPEWNAVNLFTGKFTPTRFDEKLRPLYAQVHFSEKAVNAINEGYPVVLDIDFVIYVMGRSKNGLYVAPFPWDDRPARMAIPGPEITIPKIGPVQTSSESAVALEGIPPEAFRRIKRT